VRKQIPIIQEMEAPFSQATSTTYAKTYQPMHKNGFLDVYKDSQDASQRIFLVKRPGLGVGSTQLNPAVVPAVNSIATCGSLAPDGTTNHFIVYTDGTLANTVFCYNGAITARPGGWALSGVAGAGAGAHDIIPLASTSTSGSYAGNYWALTSYNTGAVISSTGAVTQIVDVDYTAWTKKTNIVALDGYLFQADTNTSYIYNSDLNVPTSWTATGRILADSHPGTIMKLVRVRNYIVAFKTGSLEFFEDLGNPTPGSPLSPVPQLTQRYGASAPHLIVDTSDGVMFAGFDPSGRAGIFKLHNNTLSVVEVGNAFMSQLVQYYRALTSPLQVADARPTTYWRSLIIPFRDKELVTMPIAINGGSSNATFVYDNKLGSWAMWTAYNPTTAVEDGFPSFCMIRRGVSTVGPEILFANPSDYKFSVFSDNLPGDFSTHAIDFRWNSSWMDFGTTRRKFMPSLTVSLDSRSGNVNNIALSLIYRDGDIDALVSATRTVTWSSAAAQTNKKIKFDRLGSFVARQFVIGVNDSTTFVRIGAIEVDLDMAEDDIS
jgi:hypothetical protein